MRIGNIVWNIFAPLIKKKIYVTVKNNEPRNERKLYLT